ncbi:hypothetical protein [Arthrobacter sp. KK5.5]|uniref:hypothetical protein n=1 Tax=Arthrobacter sp. KK5.5 TaxID=3373084 RepID=UPI003EE76B8F
MSDAFDDTVFDERADDDLNGPEDGRDGQPYEGSSDAPESMDGVDPLHKHNYLLDDDLETAADLDDEDAEEEWDDEEPRGERADADAE